MLLKLSSYQFKLECYNFHKLGILNVIPIIHIRKYIKNMHKRKNGLKNRVQLYAIYKRVTLNPKIQIVWKWKDGKRCSMPIVTTTAQSAMLKNRLSKKKLL